MDSACTSGRSTFSQVSPPSLVIRQGGLAVQELLGHDQPVRGQEAYGRDVPAVPGMAVSLQVIPLSDVL